MVDCCSGSVVLFISFYQRATYLTGIFEWPCFIIQRKEHSSKHGVG